MSSFDGDPKRLLVGGDVGADLLRAARRHRPTDRARSRTMRAAVTTSAASTTELAAWRAVVFGLVALAMTVGGAAMTAPAAGMPWTPSLGAPDEMQPLPNRAPTTTHFLGEQSSS